METPEEFVGSNDQIHTIVAVKGRRSNKRMRLLSSGLDATSSSSCGGADEFPAASSSISGDTNNLVLDDDHHEISTEEEEDMANCLILLAQGDSHRRPRQILQDPLKIDKITAKRFNFEMSKTTGFYVYECKTCNRTFPSFQALGGHRASHKKPKLPITTLEEPEESQFIKIVTPVQIPTKGTTGINFQAHKGGKVHECSICGLEFTSGQALGGHMRRHRATTAVSSAQQLAVATNTEHNNHHHRNSSEDQRKERNILELDLNLPAPEDDLRETKFQFTATPQTIVFSAPTLVDCHY
ncbi:zinc finger protein ZAT5 [Benincasa hispida]|uniref:zinc finger protein ZAT5 n=1 Tax=Benincasa hispida TaxID=102211 RepID=UPI0019023BC5|nr:zinc finger protein ZAT5 [Benincasa hispida]